MSTVYMICNAHLDPVWQWDVREGMGAALATFRSAAMLLERNPGFVFNHNEALLYRWVETYEPELFERIRALVREGRWHIVGGFELQPDCVMPGGESMIRQILSGQRYFQEKFEVTPRMAVQFDSFGHSRGLVQVLAKCGYEGYVFMRPGASGPEDATDFWWEGFDGSRVFAHRTRKGYNSAMGRCREELEGWMKACGTLNEAELYTWGVGNHGGGPSQKDIDDLDAMMREGAQVVHATPEQYMGVVLSQRGENLPVVAKSLYRSNVGCYTSLLEIKQAHRRLEAALLTAEKMASIAALDDAMAYPAEKLHEAWTSLQFVQFHDVLPGTLTQPVVRRMLDKCGHGTEIAQAVIDGAFFRLAQREAPAKEGTIPVLVFNPHPYPVRQMVECEFMLPDQNWDTTTETIAHVTCGGKTVPSQMIREDSSLPLDWRKKVAFEAELAPSGITRFDCALERIPATVPCRDMELAFAMDGLRFSIDPGTGCLGEVSLNGKPIGAPGIGRIAVYADNVDPWHMESFAIDEHRFDLPLVPGSVRVCEQGAVFTEVEAQFAAEGIRAVARYRIPHAGREIEISLRLTNMLEDTMIKMAFPCADAGAELLCETMFGEEKGFADGAENISHGYDCLLTDSGVFGVINDGVYGGSFRDGVLYKNLLRAPVHCAHPIPGRKVLKDDRAYERMGQGTYHYRFVLRFDDCDAARFDLAKRAQTLHEAPVAVSHFPAGTERACAPVGITLEGAALLSAIKQAEDGQGFIVRVREPAGKSADFQLKIGAAEAPGALVPYEVRALRYHDGVFTPCDFMERSCEA